MADAAFVATVSSRFPAMSKATMLADRKATCDALAGDPTQRGWVVVVKTFTDAGVGAQDAGFFIGAAVRTGCPQYDSALP